MRAVHALPLLLVAGCTYDGPDIDLDGQDVAITFLHTSDWHSRLVPYDMQVGAVDERLGLDPEQGPFGGAARAGYLLRRERGRADRVLHVDSGDCYQGAPIFNLYSGEAEMSSFSAVGLDAMVIGNHEFDRGAQNFAEKVAGFATFPVLAANYAVDPPDPLDPRPSLEDVALPFVVRNVRGLRVALIGLGNLSSLTSIYESPNRLGITPLETSSVTQFYVDLVRPFSDLVVVVSHMGLRADEETIRRTSGIDIVFGGHLHIVLSPPKLVPDLGCDEDDDDLPCRQVLLVHSGAFVKYLGRLDVVVRQAVADPSDWEVVSHRYELFPIDSAVPEDARVAELLEPYEMGLERSGNLREVIGYAPNVVRRFGSGGADSPLGNLVATSMWLRQGIQTDFAVTNTTGLRADLGPGPVTREEMVNVFPFDNTITTMLLSGREVQTLFDFVARRTAGRGCQTQAQIAGIRLEIDCGGCERTGGEPCAEVLFDRGNGETEPLDPNASYALATSDYLAGGGSGYRVLERNTTQVNTFLPMRDATVDRMRGGEPCTDRSACTDDGDCPPRQTCACEGRAVYDSAARECTDHGCSRGGECVLAACVDDLGDLLGEHCDDALSAGEQTRCACDAVSNAWAACPTIPCVDERIGAAADGRVGLVLP